MLGDGCCIVLIKGGEAYCREEVISVILFRLSLQSDDETKANLFVLVDYVYDIVILLLSSVCIP